MKFKIKYFHFYYSNLIFVILFLIIRMNYNYFYNIKGKFVFDSICHRDGIYVYEKGRQRFITNKASFPKWSADGKKIFAINYNGIIVINPKNKKIERYLPINIGQVLDIACFNNNNKFILYSLRVRKNHFFDFFIIKYNLENNSKEIFSKFLFKKINFNF